MLYEAMKEILVLPHGPLSNLYAYRLPDEQTAPVDAAFVPTSGTGATRAFGSKPVADGPVGVAHDGGVQYHHTSIQFQARGADPANPRPAAEAADAIRDVLAQFAGVEVVRAGELIARCDVTTAPNFYEQDDRERIIMAVTVTCQHRPD